MSDESLLNTLSLRRRSGAIGDTALSLSDQVADRLLESIIDGRLPPGTRLPEIALSEEHRVSRATIREALAQLERHHFVEKLHRFGARVIEAPAHEIEELYEMRAVLLGLAATRAARLAKETAIASFAAAAAALEQQIDGPDSAATYTRDALSVQARLLDMADSRWLQQVFDQISNQSLWRVLVRHKGAVFSTAERRRQSSADWRALADALQSRDEALCEAQARRLVRASREFLLERTGRDTGSSS